jgi:hypothetical protein
MSQSSPFLWQRELLGTYFLLLSPTRQDVTTAGSISARRSGLAQRETLIHNASCWHLYLYGCTSYECPTRKSLLEIDEPPFLPPPFFLPCLQSQHESRCADHFLI